MKEIEAKLREILSNNVELEIPIGSIGLNEKLSNYGVNSISFIRIIVSIETEFDIEFGDEDLDANKFPTVKSLISYVENKITQIL